jgi:hypothetical protein
MKIAIVIRKKIAMIPILFIPTNILGHKHEGKKCIIGKIIKRKQPRI